MIRMFTILGMALALIFALANTPLAQKQMPGDDQPKGKQLPADEEAEEEAEEEVDGEEAYEEESYELKHTWLADTTYTLIIDTNMHTTTVREDDDDRQSLAGTTAALQIAITELDEESGEVLAYSVEIVECVSRSGYAYGDEEMEIEADDSKLNEFEGNFERESIEDEFSLTVIQPDDKDDEFEPEKNAFISGVHVGTLEVSVGPRTLVLEGEGEELTLLDMLNDRIRASSFSFTASGSILEDAGNKRYMGELQADQTIMLYVGEAEAVIEDQDLAGLFETTEDDDEMGGSTEEGAAEDSDME